MGQSEISKYQHRYYDSVSLVIKSSKNKKFFSVQVVLK